MSETIDNKTEQLSNEKLAVLHKARSCGYLLVGMNERVHVGMEDNLYQEIEAVSRSEEQLVHELISTGYLKRGHAFTAKVKSPRNAIDNKPPAARGTELILTGKGLRAGASR